MHPSTLKTISDGLVGTREQLPELGVGKGRLDESTSADDVNGPESRLLPGGDRVNLRRSDWCNTLNLQQSKEYFENGEELILGSLGGS